MPQKEPWTGVRTSEFLTRLTPHFTSPLWGFFVTPLARIHNSVPVGRAAKEAKGWNKEKEGWGDVSQIMFTQALLKDTRILFATQPADQLHTQTSKGKGKDIQADYLMLYVP